MAEKEELKKALAEYLGIPESEITDEMIEKFLEDLKTEVYYRKIKSAV